MISIKSVTLQNFLSYQIPVELPLENQGLVLIQGTNEVSSTSSSNGAGKSAIADAIAWCFFGETLRGLKHDAVANRHNDEPCVVTLRGTEERGEWTIERTRRPAGLQFWRVGETWTNKEAEEAIESFLGFGFRTFRAGAVFSQGAFRRFAAADPDEQLRVFDEIQSIDFTTALANAKQTRSRLQGEMESIVAEQETTKAEIGSLTESIESLQQLQHNFTKDKADKIQQLKVEQKAVGEKAKLTIKRLERIAEAETNWERIQSVIDHTSLLEQAAKDALVESSQLFRERERARQQQENVMRSIQDLIASGQCPKCRQSTKQAKTLRNLFQDDIKKTSDQFLVADKKHQQAASRSIAREAELTAWLNSHQDATPLELERLESVIRPKATLEADVKFLKSQYDRLAADIKAAELSKWDGRSTLAGMLVSVETKNARLAEMGEIYAKLERGVLTAQFWADAFNRGLREFLFESVSSFVTERLLYHLRFLAGDDVDASLAIDVVRGRERVALKTSWSYGAGDYVAGSSGQDRRIDLALFAALQDLAEFHSTRTKFPIRIYDEPSDALDERGRELLAAWIRSEANGRGTTLVITHNTDFSGALDADRTWDVILSVEGSRVEV